MADFVKRGARGRSCGIPLLVLAAYALAAPAAAQSTQSGTVARITVRSSDGLVEFDLSGPRSTPPACATQAHWAIGNEASTAGRQQLALVMMAEATGKAVTVTGSGTCSRTPDAETVVEIAVSD